MQALVMKAAIFVFGGEEMASFLAYDSLTGSSTVVDVFFYE